MRRTVVIDVDQGLLLVSLSHIKRNTTMSVKIGTSLPEAWEMMWWAKHSTKFPNHLSRVESREGNFLSGSLNPRSPSIMVVQTQRSTLVTSTREWLYTPRTRPWCARYFHPAWGLWQWGGLIVWMLVLSTPSRSSHERLGLISLRVVGFLGPWILCCLCLCEKVRPWKHTQTSTRRCLMRLMGILMTWL